MSEILISGDFAMLIIHGMEARLYTKTYILLRISPNTGQTQRVLDNKTKYLTVIFFYPPDAFGGYFGLHFAMPLVFNVYD